MFAIGKVFFSKSVACVVIYASVFCKNSLRIIRNMNERKHEFPSWQTRGTRERPEWRDRECTRTKIGQCIDINVP